MRKIAQITKNICTLSILLKCVNKCTKHLLDMHLQGSSRPISAFDSLKIKIHPSRTKFSTFKNNENKK